MMKHIAILLAFLMMISSQVIANVEDTPSPNSSKSYVCDGKVYTIVDTETGWGLLNEPDVEVFTTYDGFMLVDHKSGTNRSLGKLASGAGVMYVYHKNDTSRYHCISGP